MYFFCNEGHRTLFIGVHVPLGGRKSHRRHRHRGHKHRKRDRERDSGLEDGRESPSFGKPHSLCFNKLFLQCRSHCVSMPPIPSSQTVLVSLLRLILKICCFRDNTSYGQFLNNITSCTYICQISLAGSIIFL